MQELNQIQYHLRKFLAVFFFWVDSTLKRNVFWRIGMCRDGVVRALCPGAVCPVTALCYNCQSIFAQWHLSTLETDNQNDA